MAVYNGKQFIRKIAWSTGLLLLSATMNCLLSAELDERIKFHIESQTLSTALIEFSDQAQVQVLVAAADIEGIHTDGVKGEVTRRNAIRNLLKNTSLQFQYTGTGTVTITDSNSNRRQPRLENNNLKYRQDSGLKDSDRILLAQTENAEAGVRGREGAAGQKGRSVLEEVVVTAQKREAALQDTPISITALTVQDIERYNMTDLAEVARVVPNFKLNHGRDSTSQATVHVRGIGQSDELGDPGVGIYIDGIYLARQHAALFKLNDIERIEILRGPQGTLFGRNTIGGAVNVVTRQPTDEAEFSAELGAGSYDSITGAAYGQVPIIEDRLFARAAIYGEKNSGFTENTFLDEELNNNDVLTGRFALRALPTENLEINWSADVTRDESDGPGIFISGLDRTQPYLPFIEGGFGSLSTYVTGDPAGVSDLDSHVRKISNDSPNKHTLDIWGTALNISWDAGDYEFRSITGYREIEELIQSDLDGTPFPIFDQDSDEFEQWQVSQEFQLLGEAFNDRLTWLLGAYYFLEEHRLPISVIFDIGLGVNFGFDRTVQQEVETIAGFGSATYVFTDKFSATVGARYSSEDKTLESLRIQANGTISFNEPGISTDFNNFSPKIALDYQLTQAVLAYASFSKGFKSGGFNPRADVQGETQPFDPEKVYSFEAGIKSRWFDDRLQANIAGFYMDYSDIQQQVFITDPSGAGFVSTVANAAEATIAGLELEVMARPTDNFFFSGTLGYTDAEFDEFIDATLGDLSDREFQNTPEITASIAAEYSVVLAQSWEASLGAFYSYQSEVFFDPKNVELIKEDGFDLLDLNLKITPPNSKFQLEAFIKNVTDELYRTNGVDTVTDLGYALNYFGAPRTFGVNLRVQH